MPAKGKKRSARKQTPQCECQEQIKDILRRLESLEADQPKIVCEIKPASAERLLETYQQCADYIANSIKVVPIPPNPQRERILNKMRRELIAHDVAHEIARQLPKGRKRLSK